MVDLAERNKIKVIDEFISAGEATYLADYIDFLEQNDSRRMNSYQEGKRLAFQFGRDIQYDWDSEYKTYVTIDALNERPQREAVKKICRNLVSTVEEFYKETRKIYVASIWLAKQYPGCVIPPHDDTDGGYNSHFVYSGVLYLNKLENGGEISFIELDYVHKPKVGDLIVFPTQTTGNHAVLDIPEPRYSIAFWLTTRSEMAVKGLD